MSFQIDRIEKMVVQPISKYQEYLKSSRVSEYLKTRRLLPFMFCFFKENNQKYYDCPR